MRLLILFLVIVFGGLGAFYFSIKSVPIVGLVDLEGGETVIVSRRPPVFFRPSDDMRFVDAGWKSVRPEDQMVGAESYRVSFARYKGDKGSLVTVVAETSGEWEWIAAHHVPFPALHSMDEPYENERRYESVFLLNEKNNPFSEEKDVPCIAYRGKFLLLFRKAQVFFEYHEPIDPEKARNVTLYPEYLQGFIDRGRASCIVAFPSRKATDGLKTRFEKLNAASDSYSRQKLSFWLGELKAPAQHR
ncbi:MAG: DUF4851 domain-containing protein [Desulfovibrionaceae bacterium]|nr:DUF4851 domain-containing protein [Desulfovibrionaceae bacterium]